MAWVALKAVYMAQPSRIAKPATCSVRSNSLRRTCRNLARSGAAVTLRDYVAPAANTDYEERVGLGLLDARDLLQGGDPLLDGRVGVEQVVEEAAVVLGRIFVAHLPPWRSWRFFIARRPLVTVTAGCGGSRRVAKAFGLGSSIM